MGRSMVPYGASLPDGWGSSPLKYLTSLSNGYVFKSQDWKESGTPIIRIENLNGSQDFNYSDSDLNANYKITKGDLLFSWSGNPGTSFGPFKWSQPGDFYLNQHIFKLDVSGCDTNWLFWALTAATRWIERELTSGMIGMVHVTKEDLKNVPIPIPPLAEQRRIADFLDTETSYIDQLEALQGKVLERLEERDRARRDSLLDALVGAVGEVPFRRFITRIDQGESPQCDATPRDGNEWGVLKLSAVKKGNFNPAENKRLPDGVEPRPEYETRPGDLLVTRANTPHLVGDVAVVGDGAKRLMLPDLIYRVGLDASLTPEFVAQVALGSRVRLFVEAVARGSSQSMVKLRGEDIREWPIPAATRTQQESLLRQLSQSSSVSENLQSKVRRQLTLLAERRQTLIAAAVTGQIDVTTAGRAATSGGIA
ncbi:restriction endonuclease subunit S [Streptomyces monashensis]|uniref:restriction endonuclease subunit S n=1 Tax=Streptomyces monashensis TaxID=1678012 RepID=UPI0033FB3F41